jgi:hypothetical protein
MPYPKNGLDAAFQSVLLPNGRDVVGVCCATDAADRSITQLAEATSDPNVAFFKIIGSSTIQLLSTAPFVPPEIHLTQNKSALLYYQDADLLGSVATASIATNPNRPNLFLISELRRVGSEASLRDVVEHMASSGTVMSLAYEIAPLNRSELVVLAAVMKRTREAKRSWAIVRCRVEPKPGAFVPEDCDPASVLPDNIRDVAVVNNSVAPMIVAVEKIDGTRCLMSVSDASVKCIAPLPREPGVPLKLLAQSTWPQVSSDGKWLVIFNPVANDPDRIEIYPLLR